MLRLGTVVIGAQDIDRAERFWSSALGHEERYRHADGNWRELQPGSRPGPVIGLQRSDAHPRHDPWLHVDLEVDSAAEQEAEVERLTGLGGRLADWERYPADPAFVVMEDSDGNKFCVVDVRH